MHRWKFKLLSLLLALGYSWGLTASAGFVICVGADGHLAMEPAVGRHCHESQLRFEEHQEADRDGLPTLAGRNCVDTPVPAPLQNNRTASGAAKRTQSRSGSASPDAVGLCAFTPATMAPVLDSHRPRAFASSRHPALTLLGTVELRL